MKSLPALSIRICATSANSDEEADAYLLALNNARIDERKNQAVRMSCRLESMAAFIIKHEMSCKETAEVLRQEAERINRESLELI